SRSPGGHPPIPAGGDLVRDPLAHLRDPLDDAAAAAFDTATRPLGPGDPAVPALSRAAVDGDPTAFSLPRAMLRPKDAPFTFSFSGLKTAVARTVETLERAGEPVPVADIAASFEQAVVDVLVTKSLRAVRERDLDTLVIVGGVAANARLRAIAQERCDAEGIELRIPPPRLCTDNGAMIAAVGDLLVRSGAQPSGLGIAADPSAVLHGAQLPLLR